MADRELLEILRRGPKEWNAWREKNPARTYLDLRYTSTLNEIKLPKADLRGADLRWSPLTRADFSGCDFRGADLMGCNLRDSNCEGADLTGAGLQWVSFVNTNLSYAKLPGTQLRGSTFIHVDARGADFTGCNVYGVSVWSIETDESTKQSGLVVTEKDQHPVTVDDIEVAQFVHHLLDRRKLIKVLDTITSKTVLILGRFTLERKRVLDGIAGKLRMNDLWPIIFDFERASSRDFTETIKTLTGSCKFVIADITEPRSAPLELQAVVPEYQIPFVPIIQEGEEPFSMFQDLQKYPWMMELLRYPSLDVLLDIFEKAILDRALKKDKDLVDAKAQRGRTLDWRDFLGPEERQKGKGAEA